MSDPELEGFPLKVPDDPRDAEQIRADIVQADPVEMEPQINTLDKPLIIECACPGWQSKDWAEPDAYNRHGELPPNYEQGGERYPAIPCSLDEQAEEIIKAAEAGCAASHVHPRDPDDCFATDDLDRLHTIYEKIYAETDVVPLQHTWEFPEGRTGEIDYVSLAKEKIELTGDTRLCEGAVVLWPTLDAYPMNYTESVQEGIEFYEEHNIKPIHKIRSAYNARRLYRDLVEPGVMTHEPFVLIHDMGHPFGWPMDQDPWMPIDMIASLEQTRQRFSDHDILTGVYSGGRNWLPITMTAILAGVDVVRVGIEDFYWMYPHRDDVIQRNIDCVRKITEFCESIGRELATPEQAREIMGLT